MIILSLNIEERRDYRVQHCYPDIVFQRSHHVIHKHAESLGMEAIYASATLFSQFLLDNKIANPDYIGYEIDDLQVELPNMTDLLLLLTVTYLRLCCASKEPALSNEIAKGVKKYCFSMPCLTEQLKKMEDVKALFSHSPHPKAQHATAAAGMRRKPAEPHHPWQLGLAANRAATNEWRNEWRDRFSNK